MTTTASTFDLAADFVGTRDLTGRDAFFARVAFRAAAGRGTPCEAAYAVEQLERLPELDLTSARALLMPNRGNAYAQARDEASLFGMALAAERTNGPGPATAVLFTCLAEDLYYERNLTAAPAADEDDVVATVEFTRLTGIDLF